MAFKKLQKLVSGINTFVRAIADLYIKSTKKMNANFKKVAFQNVVFQNATFFSEKLFEVIENSWVSFATGSATEKTWDEMKTGGSFEKTWTDLT